MLLKLIADTIILIMTAGRRKEKGAHGCKPIRTQLLWVGTIDVKGWCYGNLALGA